MHTLEGSIKYLQSKIKKSSNVKIFCEIKAKFVEPQSYIMRKLFICFVFFPNPDLVGHFFKAKPVLKSDF